MNSCFGFTRALRAHVSRLSILVLLLASTVAYADPPPLTGTDNDILTYNVQASGGGAVSYWLLAFLLAVNIAGVIHMRRLDRDQD